MNVAEKLVEILHISFTNEISEENYHEIIACIRKLKNILDAKDLWLYFDKYNFPKTYDPFVVSEQLRFAFVFGKENNKIKELCTGILLHNPILCSK